MVGPRGAWLQEAASCGGHVPLDLVEQYRIAPIVLAHSDPRQALHRAHAELVAGGDQFVGAFLIRCVDHKSSI